MAKYEGRGQTRPQRTPKAFRKAQKLSEAEGWTWRSSRNQHVNVHDPGGNFVTCISQTAYDGKLTRIKLSHLRKAGCPGA